MERQGMSVHATTAHGTFTGWPSYHSLARLKRELRSEPNAQTLDGLALISSE